MMQVIIASVSFAGRGTRMHAMPAMRNASATIELFCPANARRSWVTAGCTAVLRPAHQQGRGSDRFGGAGSRRQWQRLRYRVAVPPQPLERRAGGRGDLGTVLHEALVGVAGGGIA